MSLPDRVLESAGTEATARGEALKTDPGVVWHYTDASGLLSILRRDVLWATSAAFLNDKNEVALGGQRMAERIRQLADSSRSPLLARLAADIRNVSTQGRGPSLLLIKHEGFVHEQETPASVVLLERYEDRATARLAARLVRYRGTPYGITPYLELTGCPDGRLAGTDDIITETRQPLPIRAVAISPSPNGPAATMSLKQVLEAHGYDDVPVLRSAIPFRG